MTSALNIVRLLVIALATLFMITAIRLLLLTHFVQYAVLVVPIVLWKVSLYFGRVLLGNNPDDTGAQLWIGVMFIVVAVVALNAVGFVPPALRWPRLPTMKMTKRRKYTPTRRSAPPVRSRFRATRR
ncbi:MAG TPA: hypothetical protein VFE46_01790 [Pirellulales bacterium]|jgi:hypothetical protein|nr:hypothetical protein [Pirellulales bacterium]